MSKRSPAEVFPPGDLLREELETRGWKQSDLAEILGRDVTLVNQIISGKRSITPESAVGLAAAFGTSPEFWLRLEQSYRLWLVKDDISPAISRRATLYSSAPISEMSRRGWIEYSENVQVLEKRLLAFFDAENLEEIVNSKVQSDQLSICSIKNVTPSQRAWLARAKQLADTIQAAPYTGKSLENVLERMRLLTHNPEEVSEIPRILRENGIRFVIVEPLAGTKIDGACFWLNSSPIIALSTRFNRIDSFWFTLMHELGHCAQGEASLDCSLETSRANMEKSESERIADEFAVNSLIDLKDLNNFMERKRPLYSTASILSFAREKNIHPGIVVGYLQYQNELKSENFRKLLVPIRDYVTASAITDGWGYAAAA